MIGFFPDIYPDELAYSWIARYYERSGYPAYIDALRDIYEKMVSPDIYLINKLSDEAYRIMTSIIPFKNIVMNHTMFLYYSRFLPSERRQRAFEGIMHTKRNIHDLLAIPCEYKKGGKKRYVRYCPICANEDRATYGETYMHRAHQMLQIDVCPFHLCYLKESKILISGCASPRLYTLNQEDLDFSVKYSNDEGEISITKYVWNVFTSPINMYNSVATGSFIHSKLAGTVYRSTRGKQRNMVRLNEEYQNFYSGVLKEKAGAPWSLEKILNNAKWNTFDICLLSMFLGIKENELTNPSLPEKSQEESFDEKAKELRAKGLSYSQIAKEMSVSINLIAPLLRGRIGSSTGNRVYKGGVKKRDWVAYDEEMLDTVKNAAEKIYSGDGGRPYKVTVSGVETYIGIKHGRIKNMPKCRAIIKAYAETQEHYWAREVIWAVEDIKKSGEGILWRNIRTRTNMKREDFVSCFQEILNANAYVYQIVQGI